MVVAAPAAASIPSSASSVTKNSSSTSRSSDQQPNTSRRPLTPSERDNAASSRRLRSKEITSRYMPSYSSSSNSTSYTSNASTSSSLSSSSSRRCPSPLPNQRPSTPSKFSPAVASKRSQSVDRTRPSTPRADLLTGVGATIADRSNAARALCTTTRSLSVSFQGESFFYQTSKAKTNPPVPARKPTPERRRSSTPAKNSSSVLPGQVENSKPTEHHHRWPAASTRQSNLLSKSLDCSAEKQELFSTVKLLRQTMLFDNGTGRASFDGVELSASSDTDSVSSGSNSGTPVLHLPRQARVSSQGVSMPARFWQETNSRIRSLPEPLTPLASSGPRNSAAPKLVSVRRSLIDRPLHSLAPLLPTSGTCEAFQS
ncbi:hypothetical protein HPP92_007531 [Vanilla planifolia]|uniref:Uncharacterized protein n=1 Tax=Vanilla planifolia TaxID=51239 RepID=A0A835RR22_VANPL|nr:hypothetical protein HPP92_007755 [Vanilla planifolia]KAG0490668.1 hypothetical protein HPP92_007531 [Vanilla planifolia]